MPIKKPRILYVPWDNPVHDDEAWTRLNSNFDLITYDFDSVEAYMEELRKPCHGKIGFIDGICRSTWLKSNPYVHHYIFRGEAVRLLPKSVRIIVQSGHGYDIVDVEYLTSRGIIFCNSPDSCSRATADIGILLILNTFRYTTFAEYCVRFGNYYDSQQLAQVAEDPNGKTLGIIGMGNIGKLVALSCKSLGMNIVYHNRNQNLETEREIGGVKFLSHLDDLLATSDCILVLCPLTTETKHLINFSSFEKMKPKVRLVNIARGPIVQEAAIVDAIERGQLIGAGFDVHEFEPKINEKLLKNWKITLLPHLGAVSESSWKNFEIKCVNNLEAYFKGQCPVTIVNRSTYKLEK